MGNFLVFRPFDHLSQVLHFACRKSSNPIHAPKSRLRVNWMKSKDRNPASRASNELENKRIRVSAWVPFHELLNLAKIRIKESSNPLRSLEIPRLHFPNICEKTGGTFYRRYCASLAAYQFSIVQGRNSGNQLGKREAWSERN